MPNKQSHYLQTDLIILLILFLGVSLLAIYNAQQLDQYAGKNFVLQQAVWYVAGTFVLVSFQFFDLEQIYKVSIYIYIFGVLLLVALYVSPETIAPRFNDAKSWFNFKEFGIPLSIQPSEFTKIGLIVYLAALVSRHKEKYKQTSFKTDLFLLLKIVVVTALPVLFIITEPDLGTSLVILFIGSVIVLLSGIDWKMIGLLMATISAVAGALVGLIIKFPDFAFEVIGIKRHQINRVLTWFDPTSVSDTFQIDRSLQSVGSGQLFGKGMRSLQVYLPEAHTDFIFSVIGESFGFIGAALVILLYFLLLYKLVTLGLQIYKFNEFGAYICFGFMSLMLIHTFQNIGMTIGIMPITGIPLLLVSYGGSSILSTMIGYALVYRVAVEYDIQNDYLFK
ncbi:MAG TPA: FtsW/RodA/SpoVE family cell cycle protein [Bacillota bacterium]|nr:FtsW/RodA/SpoVE family cell cycle protein [Bacillota bacterium]